MSSEIHNNVCEICGKEGLSGILSDNELRYSCIDHYLQVYQKIKEEKEKKGIRNEF
jgi:hypothetical protein